MIARRWRAAATDHGVARYRQHFTDSVLPQLQALAGFRGAFLLEGNGAARPGAGIEIEVVTLWESLDAVRRFAAPDIALAVVEPEARAALLDFEREVVHLTALRCDAARESGTGQEAGSSSVRAQVSEAEWRQRVDLAACYRLVARHGWDDLIFTHISARVPGPEHHFLINPYGMTFDEITASSLVKVDLDGAKVMDGPYEINPAGFTIHSAIHAAREDAGCVLHVHTLDGVAVSAQQQGLLPISQQSIFVLASLGYHDYEGVALREQEKPRLVNDLGDKNFLMLRNHGLLTVAESIPDAFQFMYLFEAACRIQVRAQAGGAELIPIDPQIIAGATSQARKVTRGAGGSLAWPALLRRLDRMDPSYRG